MFIFIMYNVYIERHKTCKKIAKNKYGKNQRLKT